MHLESNFLMKFIPKWFPTHNGSLNVKEITVNLGEMGAATSKYNSRTQKTFMMSS